ncbi:MAG: helix-turn-helix domain-containing protein [Acidobacteriaceae bacterium]
MKFDTLHENLRLEILRRIDRGLLTGSTLARATDFQQAHISNFLNRKRSLSLEGLDRVLTAQNLSIMDLLPADAFPSVPIHGRNSSLTQTVAVVTHTAAASSTRIQPPEIIDTIEVPDAIIQSSRANPISGKELWQRFVAVRVDGMQAAAMEPILRQHFIVVIDRHYNSLAPYRSQPPTVYAVRGSDALHLCFLEFEADRLILRPRNQQIPVLLIALAANEQPADRIVGRVCYVLSEF